LHNHPDLNPNNYSHIELKEKRSLLSKYKNSFSESEINKIILDSKTHIPVLDDNFQAVNFWKTPTSKLSNFDMLHTFCSLGEYIEEFEEISKHGADMFIEQCSVRWKDDPDFIAITPQELKKEQATRPILSNYESALRTEPNLIRQLLLGIDSAKRKGYRWRGIANSNTSKSTYYAYEKDYEIRLVINWNKGRPEAFIREFYSGINTDHRRLLSKLKHFTKMAKKSGIKKIFIADVELDTPTSFGWWGEYTFELEMMGVNVKGHRYGR
jgi:hypothetical protein